MILSCPYRNIWERVSDRVCFQPWLIKKNMRYQQSFSGLFLVVKMYTADEWVGYT